VRAVQLAQGAAQGLDLVFIGILLPLGEFERLQDFLHVVERMAQGLEDAVDLFNGAFDGGGRGRARLPGRRRGMGSALEGGKPVNRFGRCFGLSRRRRLRLGGCLGLGGRRRLRRRLRLKGRW
jgi:hypothetical protein